MTTLQKIGIELVGHNLPGQGGQVAAKAAAGKWLSADEKAALLESAHATLLRLRCQLQSERARKEPAAAAAG